MDNQIELSGDDYVGTQPLYAVVVGSYLYWNGTALEKYVTSHWPSYALQLTKDATTGLWSVPFPAAPNGPYTVTIYEQLGANPATTDTNLVSGSYQQEAATATFNSNVQLAYTDYGGLNPVYFVAYQLGTDQYWNGTSGSFETYAATDWPSYATPMVAFNGPNGYYNGSFPPAPDVTYYVTIYEQLGSTPATTDLMLAESEYQQEIEPLNLLTVMQLDAQAFLRDFSEPVIYTAYADDASTVLGTYYINAVVNRELPQAIQEDGKNLADLIEINIANDPVLGVTTINKGRDKITVSGKYGGPVKARLVSQMVNGDSGIWTVRCKGD